MNKKILNILILIIGILFAGIMAISVAADTKTSGISYPVTELGNCADKTACKVYCDDPAHVEACLSFAEKNNLMSKDEIKTAKNFKNIGMTGPGGCKGKSECNSYCNNPGHMDECVTFAEKNGLMSSEQLDEAKKVKNAIDKGIKPPACGGKESCDSYCSSSEHVEECITFGEAAGIIKKEDADLIRKGGSGGDRKGPDGQGPPDQGEGDKGGDRNGQGPQGQGGPGGDRKGPGGKGGPKDGGPGGQGGPGDDGKGPGGQGGPDRGGGQGPGGGKGQGPGGRSGGGNGGGGNGGGGGGNGGGGGGNGGGGNGRGNGG